MKPIKERIKESQDFYNGMAIGAMFGMMGAIILVSQGVVVTTPRQFP